MSIVDKVLNIIENDLNIKISKKKKQIIYDNFYTDITDKIYNENVNLDENKINKNIVMLIVDKVLDIIENDLNIKISKKKKQIIYNNFYPDIKDKIYWSYRIENSIYEGTISKEEYAEIKREIFSHIY